jgi:hypothetical protein
MNRSTMVAPVIGSALVPALDSGTCPHLAVLLRSEEEFAPVVASTRWGPSAEAGSSTAAWSSMTTGAG